VHSADLRAVLWTATAPDAPPTPPLDGERRADVAVVGGGYTGLSAALHLAEGGADTVLLEAAEPGFGASGRNNGQVIPVYSRHAPEDMIREYGAERGERMNAWVGASADLVFALIRRHAIDCDAARQGWLQPAHTTSRIAAIAAKCDQWAARGADVAMLDRAQTEALTGSPIYHGAWLHRGGGHIQPLAYARGLARAAIGAGAAVHGHSPVRRLSREGNDWRVETPDGAVRVGAVILAANAHTDRLWPGLARSIIPVRSFHVATAPLDGDAARTVLPHNHGLSDTRQALWAFRRDRDGRLVTTAMPLFPAGARGTLRRSTRARLRRAFPQIGDIALDYIWEGRIAMTLDRLPHFHELAPGVWTGLGYSGRGIALATAMGRLLAERAMGRAPRDLPIPTTALETLPLHRILVPLSRALILYYRWRDRRA